MACGAKDTVPTMALTSELTQVVNSFTLLMQYQDEILVSEKQHIWFLFHNLFLCKCLGTTFNDFL